MPIGLLGRKCGMTRIFNEVGVSIPVTVIQFLSNRIVQVKTVEKDGYRALQVAYGEKETSRISQPLLGHYKKATVAPGILLREFRLLDNEPADYQVGAELTVSCFEQGKKVDVRGLTRGKGFAGVVKLHHFRTQDATHGNSLSHRAPGSIGQCQTPGRVVKGKKMAAHMGNCYRTVQNLMIVKVDLERHLLLIKGAVSGAPGGCLMVQESVKHKGVQS